MPSMVRISLGSTLYRLDRDFLPDMESGFEIPEPRDMILLDIITFDGRRTFIVQSNSSPGEEYAFFPAEGT